jgi:NADH:ubiquinone oxidoreductase subunit H
VSESPYSTMWIAVIVAMIIILPTLVAPLAAWAEKKIHAKMENRWGGR